ncbi:MAG: acyltransferase [Lachnospiraceae bacterium]|nr:acyltransferase [Candidatus Colinaster equi]
MNVLLLIFPILYLALTFYGCKCAPKGEFAQDILDHKQTKMLQATACMGVVLHHITQLVTTYGEVYKGPITILSQMGILFTAIFFFVSGYGLIVSVRTKDNYLKGFLQHRMTLILVPFFLSNTIYILIRIFYNGIPTSTDNIIRCLLGLRLLNGNGWYIVEIFMLYAAFYIIFRVCRNKAVGSVLLSVVALVIIYIGLHSGHSTTMVGDSILKGEWWYNSTIAFVFGIFMGNCKDKVIDFSKRFYKILLPLFSILFIAGFVIEERVRLTKGYYNESAVIDGINDKAVTLCAQSILCLIFVYLLILIGMKISLNNKVLGYIGTISMEIFLIHGLFLHNIFDFTYINDFVTYVLIVVCAVIAGAAMHFVDTPIIRYIQGIGKNKGYLEECGPDLIRERRVQLQRKVKTVIYAVAILCLLAYVLYMGCMRFFFAKQDVKKEIDNLKNVHVQDEITFGRYNTKNLSFGNWGKEKLQWLVLDDSNDVITLITKDGIEGSTYYDAYEAVGWEDSSLRRMLNEKMYESIFTDLEKEMIVPTEETGDMVTLLSVSETKMWFASDEDRQINITDVAEKNGTNVNNLSKVNYWDMKDYRSSWWWLRGETKDITAPIVSVDGEIIENEKYVNKPNGAVRPVIRIDKNKLN